MIASSTILTQTFANFVLFLLLSSPNSRFLQPEITQIGANVVFFPKLYICWKKSLIFIIHENFRLSISWFFHYFVISARFIAKNISSFKKLSEERARSCLMARIRLFLQNFRIVMSGAIFFYLHP